MISELWLNHILLPRTLDPNGLLFIENKLKSSMQVKEKLGLHDDLEAYILDLDASRVSATISKNFDAVELLDLEKMMVHRQYDKIDAYEKKWRARHKIPAGYPFNIS